MFFRSYRENPLSLLRMFAVFGLTVIVLCGVTTITTTAQTNRSAYLDFTGDGKTDWAVFTPLPASGQPYRLKILGNQTGSTPNPPLIRIFDYGIQNDILLFGDYIGDRKTDLVAWRRGQSNNIFYTAQFPIGTGGIVLDRAVQWGAETDGVAHGDYDGDGKIDFTALRYSNNGLTWFILSSNTGAMRVINFGGAAPGFFPIRGADFTGDGRDELVVASEINGTLTYYVGDAVTGAWLFTRQWGFSDPFIDRRPPLADYTGDGKADFVAVRRTGSTLVWYILDPASNTSTATLWGIGGAGSQSDIPVAGDYDGDGRSDIAVYRPTNQTFYVLKSSDNGLIVQQWGEAGDHPLDVPTFIVIA